MKAPCTNRDFLEWNNQGVEIRNSKPSLMDLVLKMSSRLNTFYDDNGGRIKVVQERANEINKKYWQHDEKGVIITAPVEGKPGQTMNLIQEGKTEEEYKKEITEFLDIKTYVEI